MSSIDYFEYNGTEVINLARTVRRAHALGVRTVAVQPSRVAWIEATRGGSGYANAANAPWYDAQVPASAEFAGIVPLDVDGIDNSSMESTPTEYITDGGHSGKPRNATLPLVFNVVIVASTERGAEFGRRWLAMRLRDTGSRVFCNGADLTYYRHADAGAPLIHRRDVRMTRGLSVTRKTRRNCSALWFATFTMTAADPYEYGEAVPKVASIGGTTATGPGVTSQGTITAQHTMCPQWDYTPIYDPAFPALVAPPSAPDFLPDGWGISTGMTFQRRWARISPVEPSELVVVPQIVLTASQEARMVRVSVWPSDSPNDDQCDPLFSAVVTYLPANTTIYIDGEQKAAYAYDGVSDFVRRTDSLVYAPDAKPVEWAAFASGSGLLVTLDTFALSGGGYQGGGTVRASVALIPKSD